MFTRIYVMLKLVVLTLFAGFLLAACTGLPVEKGKVYSTVLSNTGSTYLGQTISPYADQHPGLTGLHPLKTGTSALIARLVLIAKAEQSLDVQYYIWHDDMTGKLMFKALLDAADRGVRVRLLLDDMDTKGKDALLAALDSHPNLELRLFNPFNSRSRRLMDFATDLGRVNHRMHNKSLTADNQATIVGGRNIGNEYFQAGEHVQFADLDTLAIGSAVDEVSQAFDLYWNHRYVLSFKHFYPEYDAGMTLGQLRVELRENYQQVKTSSYAEAIREAYDELSERMDELDWHWGRAATIYDDPIKIEGDENREQTHLGAKLSKIIGHTKRELVMVSPYFVPGRRFVDYIVGMEQEGIDVKILTNSLAATDVAAVHAGYMGYRMDLLAAGAEIFEYKPGVNSVDISSKFKVGSSSGASLHAKTLTIDGRWIFIGSFNIDPRSAVWNTEIGIIAEAPGLAGALSEGFKGKLKEFAFELAFYPSSRAYVRPPLRVKQRYRRGRLEWLEYEAGKITRFNKEPYTAGWQRLLVSLIALLPIENQL